MASTDQHMTEARERFAAAKAAWSDRRSAYSRDMRFTNVIGGQWDPAVKSDREESDFPRPALEFNELHTFVQEVSNRARQERPTPTVGPGDDGDAAVAAILESKLRHCWNASQGDVACDNAVECAAGGGFGFYRFTHKYVGKSFHQEPRVERILDSLTVLFDPKAEEADYSDADYCFIFVKRKRTDFERLNGVAPSPFDSEMDHSEDWGDEETVTDAEYYYVVKKKYTLCQLSDGTTAIDADLSEEQQGLVTARREDEERCVYKEIIDGVKVIKKETWPSEWIPIIPVLGREVVVEGKRHLISTIRFALDSQKLKNASGSAIAEGLSQANDNPYIGYDGQFRSQAWRDGRKHRYLTVPKKLSPDDMQLAPLPQRTAWEPPIQSLIVGWQTYSDSIKRSVGYVDSVPRPSQQELSGVAIQRRTQQSDLTNFHILDNLVRSQWHAGRVMLDMLLNLTDTPRGWQIMKKDGTVETAFVTMMQDDGSTPSVRGKEGEIHHRIDLGDYHVSIATGPTYQRKVEEESEFLMQALQADPQLWPLYADVVFKLKGYPDLEERAQLAQPPQVQQAIAAKAKGIPPQFQAMMMQKDQQIQQLGQGLQKLMTMVQTKQIEAEGRIKVEVAKTTGQLAVEAQRHGHEAAMTQHGHAHEHRQQGVEHAHEAAIELFKGEREAIQHLMDMLHTTEMAPDPNAQAKPNGRVQ